MNPFVIVNPAAGGGREKVWDMGGFDHAVTSRPGDARVLAKKVAREGYGTVVACGGDGTIHEVVNGIYEAGASPQPALGILSAGTGGDLIKTLQIPKGWKEQLKVISNGNRQTIDLGRVTYTNRKGKKESRVFVNIADAGLGAEVVRRLPRARDLFGRKLAYLFSTLASFLAWKPAEIRIETDPSIDFRNGPKKSLSVVIANGRYFGGGMPIAPAADPSDGLFDLVTVGAMNPLTALLAVPLLYTGRLTRLSGVRMSRVKKIRLTSQEKVGLDIDGEPVGSLPVTFEILPRAMEVLVP